MTDGSSDPAEPVALGWPEKCACTGTTSTCRRSAVTGHARSPLSITAPRFSHDPAARDEFGLAYRVCTSDVGGSRDTDIDELNGPEPVTFATPIPTPTAISRMRRAGTTNFMRTIPSGV